MWFGPIKAVSAVCLDYLLIKSLHLDKPPDIQKIPKLTGKQNSFHSQFWLQKKHGIEKEDLETPFRVLHKRYTAHTSTDYTWQKVLFLLGMLWTWRQNLNQ